MFNRALLSSMFILYRYPDGCADGSNPNISQRYVDSISSFGADVDPTINRITASTLHSKLIQLWKDIYDPAVVADTTVVAPTVVADTTVVAPTVASLVANATQGVQEETGTTDIEDNEGER